MAGGAGLIFIAIFGAMIIIPCVVVGWMGCRFIDNLGRYPTKTPVLQTGMLFWLFVTEVTAFTLILAFFKILVAE